jgi:hypothetical protein
MLRQLLGFRGLLAQFGRERLPKILGLEHLANLDL